jgi:hypothetical protein
LNIKFIDKEYKLFNPTHVIRFNGKISTNIELLYPFPEDLFKDFKKRYFYNYGNKKPSTGITAIYFLLDYLKIPSITITGFDFFKTKNFYHGVGKNTIHEKFHDPKLEEQLVDKYIEEGRLKIL